jgi:competence protein ComEC
MRVRFYDVGQGLSALVELPDGRRLLVDAGEAPNRPGCGESCRSDHARLLQSLAEDLRGRPLDALWITHQHSDHIGGAPGVMRKFQPTFYLDNGSDLSEAPVAAARRAAQALGVEVRVIDPQHRELPLASTPELRLTAELAPRAWKRGCGERANDCTVGLRIDYCASSVLFAGDVESAERDWEPRPVTLLQVAHHGSATSTSEEFLRAARPRYAVISAGRPNESRNRYCHPAASTVRALNVHLTGATGRPVHAFDGAGHCRGAPETSWREVPSSEALWITARDGEVVLMTRGDGRFERE